VSVNFSSLFTFCSQVLINSPPLPLHFRDSRPFGEKPNGCPVILALNRNSWRRFANFSCPVRTHHASFVLNHLECAHLHKITPFAEAPFQWKTIPQGAATSVWAGFVAPADEIGGRYCENCHVGNVVPDDVTISAISEGVRGYALDPKNAEALWKKSEELVGESF